MRTSILALPALFCLLPLCEAFAGSFSPSAFATSAARVQLACPLASPVTRAVPALRGARSGLLSARAVEYSVVKGDEVKGGNKYTFTVTVDPFMSKDSYTAIMKDFKKNAQFPGFRKGTIPPFMMGKVKQFVILDCLEKTLSDAVKDEGLTLVSDDVKPTLDDDQTKTLTKAFKETEGFTYIIDCELKPSDGASTDEIKAIQA